MRPSHSSETSPSRRALRALSSLAFSFAAATFVAAAPAVAQGAHGVPTGGLTAPIRPAPNGYWYGDACGGQFGQDVQLAVSPPMRPGQGSTLTIENLPPNVLAQMIIGVSPFQHGGVALPLSLDWIGATGCDLLVSGDITFFFATGSGAAAASFVTPLEPVLAANPIYMQVMFEQAGLNPANFGMSVGYASRIAPMPTPTSMVTSISQHGITFDFAAPVRAGQFVNGDWFVIGPVQLADMAPACTVSNGRTLHGAMLNPDPSSHNHGYDSSLFDPQFYNDSRNVAWNLSPSNPRTLQPGDSLIKVVSNTNTALLPVLQTCAVLTVLDHAPPTGSFRPPYAGSDRTVRFDEKMIDWSQLQNVPALASMPDPVAMAANFERPWLDHAPGWVTRYMHPIDNMPDYGRDFATLYNEAALMCNSNLPMAQKRELAIRLTQIGIDFYGNVEGGAYWEGVGGHGTGRKLPILFAGALLDDEGMMSIGFTHPSGRSLDGSYSTNFGEDCQTFYVEQTGPNEVNWGHGGYDSSHVGMAEYGFSHADYPENDQVNWSTSYRLCCTANAWVGAVLVARMMDLRVAWNHEALFDYTDRYTSIETDGWTQSWSPWVGDMWTQYRPQY